MGGAVQLNDISGASLVMQAVHILRDDVLGPPHTLHLSQSIVGPVGLHCCKLMPASKASGPITSPPLLSGHELHAEARSEGEYLLKGCCMPGTFPAVPFVNALVLQACMLGIGVVMSYAGTRTGAACVDNI